MAMSDSWQYVSPDLDWRQVLWTCEWELVDVRALNGCRVLAVAANGCPSLLPELPSLSGANVSVGESHHEMPMVWMRREKNRFGWAESLLWEPSAEHCVWPVLCYGLCCCADVVSAIYDCFELNNDFLINKSAGLWFCALLGLMSALGAGLPLADW